MRRTYSIATVALLALAASAVAQQPVGEVFATDASVRGSMIMTSGGTKVMSGSQVAAGMAPAVLKLTRGGEVRICPQTSVAVSESSTNSPLLFGINTGALEMDYELAAMADSIITPDFRIQLTGPGKFHVAVGADARGNTCVRSLEGNNASVIVAEMLGNGSYQVSPGRSVVFREGKLQDATTSEESCGCPAPKITPPAVAKNTPAAPPTPPVETKAPATPSTVEMEAPLTFHGEATKSSDDTNTIATLRTRRLKDPSELLPTVKAPAKVQPVKAEQPRRGFFGKIGSFFSRLFKG